MCWPPRSNRRLFLLLSVVLVASVVGESAWQITAPANASKQLHSSRSLKCEFPSYASADWDADTPKLKTASTQQFAFHIDGIDRHRAAARIIGNAGASDLAVLVGGDVLSFLETTLVGTVNVTTVYAWQDSRGRFKAVHSRHTAIGGATPSQNYGFCQDWR